MAKVTTNLASTLDVYRTVRDLMDDARDQLASSEIALRVIDPKETLALISIIHDASAKAQALYERALRVRS